MLGGRSLCPGAVPLSSCCPCPGAVPLSLRAALRSRTGLEQWCLDEVARRKVLVLFSFSFSFLSENGAALL